MGTRTGVTPELGGYATSRLGRKREGASPEAVFIDPGRDGTGGLKFDKNGKERERNQQAGA